MTSTPDAPATTFQDRLLNRSFRSLLGAAMVATLVAASAALIGLDYVRARNAAIEDATKEMQVFAERVVDRFGVLSGDTVTLVGAVASVANSVLDPPPARMADKIAIFREGMLRSPHLDGAYVGYPDGSFFQLVNLNHAGWRAALDAPDDARMAVRIIEAKGEGSVNRVIFLDADGHTVGELPGKPSSFDPRNRPWYRAAVGQSKPVSVGPYEMATTGSLGVTVAEAHRGNRNVVVAVDIILDTITEFLASQRISQNAVAFIVDASGNPVIHSDRDFMRRITAPREDIESGPSPASDPLVRSTGDIDARLGGTEFVDVDGRTFLVAVTPITSALLLGGHRVVVAAPLDELMGPANRALLQGLAVSGTIVLLAILAALLLAQFVTKSLLRLTASANRLQSLDFSTPIDVASRVNEISTLGQAMNKARDAISTFAMYVPKELVRKGIESGHFAGRSAWRQDVTALFTDIYDFTTISEVHSPEQVVAMLSEYFDIFSSTVDAHGGTIIQFLGDSVFAMWNAPVADARHAENACRCALAIEDRIAAYNEAQRQKGRPEFRTRYGIHSGMAVVGSVGAEERLQYTAMGDTVNVASRLEGMNKDYGTTILASGAVVALCSDRIAFKALGSAQAKGRAGTLEIYEVVAVKADSSDGDVDATPSGEQDETPGDFIGSSPQPERGRQRARTKV
ncbi:adenylate/guanylate cyclase domain-containing protein [Mesorhizobium sp. 1B3]|uniref:adenylate/guanylate cyclase domain-containing protein n=1 Tax=Mesorhizobium sp. 1B3 TaxID=3243599 RepID=UPI003D998CDC